jgi:hypothetical protein
MSQSRSQAAATATFGYAGVAGGAALREHALSDAYGQRPRSVRVRSHRPMVFAERQLLKAPAGRKRYVAGATLAALSAPAAARGTHDLLSKRRTFVEDGVAGVTDSLREKNVNARRAPTPLVAGNYAAGTAVGATSLAVAQHAMRNSRIPRGGRSAIASSAAVLAGTASLPIQRRVIERKTKGAYTATPTGLKRVVKPVNHGARSGTRIAKTNDQSTGMSRAEELRNIKRKQRAAAINATTSAAGIGSLGLLGAAALPHVKNRAALVRTATTIGTASAGAGSLNGLEGARLQRRDLKAREHVLTAKAYGLPRVPRVRRGFLRQTRTATGVTTSAVRGGLIR